MNIGFGRTWVVLQIRVPFLIRMPYSMGDLNRDLNLENYPYGDVAIIRNPTHYISVTKP